MEDRTRLATRTMPWRPTLRRGLASAVLVCLALAGAALLCRTPATGRPVQSSGQVAQAVRQARLVAPDGTAEDEFGWSVAVSGNTGLVGAPQHSADAGDSREGAAYVFVRSGTGWTLEQKLVAADPSAHSSFGRAVAVSGDTALVGAPEEAVGDAYSQGAVYVFTRSGTTWTQQARLTAPALHDQDGFGAALALSGDTAVIGAPGTTEGWDSLGAAYVFARSGTTWSLQQKLLAADGQDEDHAGGSAAISGDTVLVGAPGPGTSDHPGAAFVWVRGSSGWSEQQKLEAPGGASIGSTVALSGDTALADGFAFVRAGTAWRIDQKLVARDPHGQSAGAVSTALSGDTALLGAGEEGDADAAYLFALEDTRWTQQQRLDDGEQSDAANFGCAVALSGDTALVGAWNRTVDGNEAPGAAYVFGLSSAPDTAAPTTTMHLTPAANGAGWNRSPVTLDLTATDGAGGSGVFRTWCRLGTVGAFEAYDLAASGPTISAEGITKVQFYSVDAAGNTEATRTEAVRIDSVPPTGTGMATSATHGAFGYIGYRIDDPLPSCGRAKVTFKILQGTAVRTTLRPPGEVACNAYLHYRWHCTLPPGRYTVKAYATDIAGNAQSQAGSATLTVP